MAEREARESALCMVCGADGAAILYSQIDGYVPRRLALWVCRRCYRRIAMFLFVAGQEGIRGIPTPAHPEWKNPWFGVEEADEPTERWGAGERG